MRLPGHVLTERMVLRRWAQADEPALSAAIAASVEHLRPWMPWAAGEPVAPADRIRWIEQVDRDWEAGGDVVLGMLLADGTVVGGTGLHRRAGPDTLEIGYWVHVDHVGQGLATEAAAGLTDAAFAIAGIEHVEIHHDRANLASRRVPEKLGYAMTGECEPTDPPAPGEDRVHWCWRIDRAGWARQDHYSPR
ncbi:MAG: GNAT family N-acetyltransferase [Acidimicrobiia bacterium]